MIDAVMNTGNTVYRQTGSNRVRNKIDKNSKLYKVSVDFEAIFIKQMLNEMRKTIDKSGIIKRGIAEDIFEDMLYDEYAKKMAENEDFGLARILYKQLSGNQ